MANITKKGERKYRVRISKQSQGVRRFVNYTIRGTLKDAREFARQQETLLDSGELDRSGLTFAAYFRLWLAAIKPKIAPRTFDGYEGSIRRYALDRLAAMQLEAIRLEHVQTIYLEIGKSPTTVRNLHAALRACFNYARRRGFIRSNPCDNADLPAKSRRPIRVLSFEEARRFVAACGQTPNGLVFEFALETGMRPEEYLALRWSDISGSEASVQQVVQYRRSGGGFYFDKPKTAKSRRRVPLSDALRRSLARHRTAQLEHRIAMRGTWFDLDLVFPNEVGHPQPLNNLSRRYLRPALAAAGLAERGITLYSLRHTCATLLLMSGENPKVVADRLGHSSVTLTLDTYSHVLPHIQADATETLNRLMRG